MFSHNSDFLSIASIFLTIALIIVTILAALNDKTSARNLNELYDILNKDIRLKKLFSIIGSLILIILLLKLLGVKF